MTGFFFNYFSLKIMNIYNKIPQDLSEEIFEEILLSKNVRIERIISNAHHSPENYWYNQEQSEWVIVLKGEAEIEYFDKSLLKLEEGDYVNIPAHTKHRVKSTSEDGITLWLAVFYD